MRVSFAVAIGVLVFAAALPPSRADFSKDNFGGLVELVDRALLDLNVDDPDSKLRKKILKKLDKTIAKKSRSLVTDAALAAKIAKVVALAGDDFPELVAALREGIENLRENVDNFIGNIEARRDALPESKFRTKATKKLLAARAAFDDAASATKVRAIAKSLKKALVARQKAARLVQKGEKRAGIEK